MKSPHVIPQNCLSSERSIANFAPVNCRFVVKFDVLDQRRSFRELFIAANQIALHARMLLAKVLHHGRIIFKKAAALVTLHFDQSLDFRFAFVVLKKWKMKKTIQEKIQKNYISKNTLKIQKKPLKFSLCSRVSGDFDKARSKFRYNALPFLAIKHLQLSPLRCAPPQQ